MLDAAIRRATRNFTGQGSKSEKGHAPDHFKAVMSCGMSVFLNQKARAEIKEYFSNVCICKTYLSMR